MPEKFKSLLHRLLTCSAVLIGGTLISGGTAGIGGALGGVAGSIIATDLHNLLSNRFGRSEEILHNPGLTKAVGTAIALVINAIAEDKQYANCKQNLQKLAPAAVTFWLDTKGEILLASEATEIGGHKNLSAVFSKNAEELAKYEALSLDSWQHILKAIGEQAQVSLPTEVINSIAELMPHTFPQALREVLKEDAEKGGKAYVEMIILLTGEIVSTTKQLDVRLQNSHQELVNRLENLQASLINSASTIEEVLKDWFSEVESGITEGLSKLNLSSERIETLLKEMTEKMSQLESQINEYLLPYLKTQNGLDLFINFQHYSQYTEYAPMIATLKQQFEQAGTGTSSLLDMLKSRPKERTKSMFLEVLEERINVDREFAAEFISWFQRLDKNFELTLNSTIKKSSQVMAKGLEIKGKLKIGEMHQRKLTYLEHEQEMLTDVTVGGDAEIGNLSQES